MPSLPLVYSQHILLADDDKDDCLLFRDALEELSFSVHLTTVHNGEELMELLKDAKKQLPQILFLDLNMPRKNGFQCLSEIKQEEKLKQLPVIIFSTSFEQHVVDKLYQQGAQYCIRKPNEFSKLKQVIQYALTMPAAVFLANVAGNPAKPPKEGFIL